jgi:hypothetical protein
MMKTVSFDIGGVVDTNPGEFARLMLRLRENLRARVILVTAIGTAVGIPVKEEGRYGFSIGRLHGLGIIRGKHYDECHTTEDYGPDPRTGQAKANVLIGEKAVLHVDDNSHVLDHLVGFEGERIHYVGQDMDHLRAQIEVVLTEEP